MPWVATGCRDPKMVSVHPFTKGRGSPLWLRKKCQVLRTRRPTGLDAATLTRGDRRRQAMRDQRRVVSRICFSVAKLSSTPPSCAPCLSPPTSPSSAAGAGGYPTRSGGSSASRPSPQQRLHSRRRPSKLRPLRRRASCDEHGAFMEPSGRNRSQSLANATAAKTAQIGENRCPGLRPVAVTPKW